MAKRFGLLTRVIAFGGLLAGSLTALAGLDQWTAQPTYGAVVQAIAVEDPGGGAPATTLYIGTAGSGVFKSTDAGANWTAKNTGLDVLDVQTLTIDPSNAAIIYAGTTTGGIFRSENAGDSWTAVNGTTDAPLKNLNVYAIAIHPSDPTKIYAATFGNVFQSGDSGATWDAIGAPTAGSFNLIDNATYALALPRDIPDLIYVGSHSNGVFKSNVGAWTNPWPSNFGVSPKIIRSIRGLVAGADGSVIYAATQCLDTNAANCGAGVAVSSDSGATWAAVANTNSGLTTKNVRTLAMLPNVTAATLNAAVVYAGATTGLFYTRDGGATWTESSPELDMDVLSIGIDPNDVNTVYAGTTEGLYVSSDGGATFTASNAGIVNFAISGIAIDPADPAIRYAATKRGGVIKTTDNGATWNYANAGLNYRELTAIAMGMATVQQNNAPVVVDAVLVGTNRGGIFRSIDAGASWTSVDTGLSTRRITKLIADPSTAQRFYAGTTAGVLVTENGGTNWTGRNTGLCPNVTPAPSCPEEVKSLAVDPSDPDTVYVSTSAAGIYKGTWIDGDISWEPITLGLTNDFVSAIAVDPTNSNNLYVGTLGGGIFASVDAGLTWTAASTGLADDFITALLVDSNTPTTLYAATKSSGVYTSTTSAATWTAINTDIANLAVTALAINDATSPATLYAGTDGDGILEIQSTAISAAPASLQPGDAGAQTSSSDGGGGGTDPLWLAIAAIVAFGRHQARR